VDFHHLLFAGLFRRTIILEFCTFQIGCFCNCLNLTGLIAHHLQRQPPTHFHQTAQRAAMFDCLSRE
jgi:hypothetical protein